MKKVLVVLLSIFSCSCSVIVNYEGLDGGYFVGSLVAEPNAYYGSYDILFGDSRGGAANISYRQKNAFGGSEIDIKSDEFYGSITIHRLPPGTYSIKDYKIRSGNGLGLIWSPREPFDYKFTIEPGKVTYVGQFRAIPTEGKNKLGMNIPTGAIFFVSNEQERDLKIAREKYGLADAVILNQVPSIKFLGE